MKIYEKSMNARSGESSAAVVVKDGKTSVWMPGMMEPIIVIEGHPVVISTYVPTITSSDVVLQTIVSREVDWEFAV